MRSAKTIADGLAQQGKPGLESKEIVALVAYLQRLGTDIKPTPVADRSRS